MALANTKTLYGSIAKTFHWLTALLIVSLIAVGWYANQLPYETDAELARKAFLFSLHKTFGVLAFFVALARILWAFTQPKPGLLNARKPLESFAAEAVHWLLYGALLIVPLSGWISHAAASGFAPIWWPFGQGLPMVPKSTAVEHLFSALHWVAGKLLIAALLLHIAGALKHHFIDRDGTLRRMLPGRVSLPPLPDQRASRAPLLSALALWIAAVLLATQLTSHEAAPASAALQQVSSDWTVSEGAITITVTQFGTPVTGTFADWTSAIRFDDSVPGVEVGSVTTTIATRSLTLGSVTQQAMGADFFDAASHETAVFDAVINRAPDGYTAVGTLTIKGMAVPFTFPFGLTVNDGIAQMRADFTLNRLDFGIGANMLDPASLALEVKLNITLTAAQTAQGS